MKRFRNVLVILAAVASLAVISGCSNNSDPLSPASSLDSTPPPAPEGLTLSPNTGLRYNELTWEPSAASDVARYEVYQYQPDPSRDNAYVSIGETTTARFEIANQQDIDTYFRVRAIDAAGNRSAFSSEFGTQVPAIQTGGGGPGSSGDIDSRKRIEE